MSTPTATNASKSPYQNSAKGPAPTLSSSPTTLPPLFHLQQTIGNQALLALMQSGQLHAKLHVSQPGDPSEQEADRRAEQVLRMPEPSSEPDTKKSCAACTTGSPCSTCAGEKGTLLHRKAEAGADRAGDSLSDPLFNGPPPGRPLDPASRAFFEPRYGRDFGPVRIHADGEAAGLAQALHAEAFTRGHDIFFDADRYQPGTPSGRQLLAHELAHVALHEPRRLWRRPYETRGIPLDRTQITSMAGESYWEQRTLQRYAAAFDSRMNADPEERDAVLAALWALNPPATVTTRRIRVVPIAARTLPATAGQTAPAQAPALLYRFTFDPPITGDTRPRLEIRFIASGASTTPVAAPPAPATYQPTQPAMSFSGFPSSGTQPDDYWAAHPDEHRALFQWMETTADPAGFNQVVTTETRSGSNVTHRSVFHVRGSRSTTGTALSGLRIMLVSEGTIQAEQTVPNDYRDRDRADLELERLRASSIPAANRLGTVTLPSTIPADERLPVKYAIWQYFESGNARNTEIDIILPVGSGSRRVLYTLLFAAHNNVTVIRVGEAGAGTGMVNMERIDVSRVRGFPGATAAPSALRSWWATRYPNPGGSLTPDPPAAAQGQPQPAGPTADVLIGEMNQSITTGVANRSWFLQNYGIEALDAIGTESRLQTAHAVPTAMLTDTIDFSTTDLLMLELSLQTLTDTEIGQLRGVKLGRKTGPIERTSAGYQVGDPTQYGLTLRDGSGSGMERTVLYFQSLYANNPNLFRGSTDVNALPDVTMGILHELGHATGYSAGIETAFNAWLAQHAQTAPTWYAATAGAERFPEFYALYHTDPHFFCNRYPQLYAWFDTLATTGAPPAANATFPAPTCPA